MPPEPVVVLEGLGKRYRVGGLAGSVPLPFFGTRLSRYETGRDGQVDDDDEVDDEEDLEEDEDEQRAATREVWALRDVSLTVPAGASLGLVGANGSGKSTLLRVLSRTTPPTEGRVVLRGRVVPLMAQLSAFVQRDSTARKNVVLVARFLGVPRDEVVARLPEIFAFAGLEDAVDRKLKHFSPGMVDRLTSATALHLGADVLLADEKLGAGDPDFRARCARRVQDLQAGGTSLVLASHRLDQVRRLCTHAVWLDGGRVRQHGEAGAVAVAYDSWLTSAAPDPPPAQPAGAAPGPAAAEAPATEPPSAAPPAPEVPEAPPARIRIIDLELADTDGRPTSVVPQGAAVAVQLRCAIGETGGSLQAYIGFRGPGGMTRRFLQPRPHVVERQGLHAVRAQLPLDGLPAGRWVLKGSVLHGHADGRDTDALSSDGIRFTIGAEPAGEPADRRVHWDIEAPAESEHAVPGGVERA